MTNTFLQDLRYAVRSLFRVPGFVAVAVLTLALGIAATTVIFTLINALLIRPLPVPEPDRLVTVEEVRRGGRTSQHFGQHAAPYERYRDIRELTGSVFSGLAAHTMRDISIRVDGPARMVSGVVASDDYFGVLGVRPAAGRFFAPAESGAPVAVISHRLWQNQFGGDASVIGRPLHVDGRFMEVIGVAPAGFGGTVVGFAADVWIPLEGYRAAAPDGADDSAPWLIAFARLGPGVTSEEATSALSGVAQRLPPEDPATEIVDVRVGELTGLPASLRGAIVGFMALLLATAGLVLLIAAINVGGLLLARAASRRREVAIRLALGGGRGRLVRLFLTESVVLFLMGGGAGVLLALWLTDLLAAIPLPVQAQVALDLGLDGPVLAFALGLALLTGLVFGLAPALQATRPDVLPALKDGGGGRDTGRSTTRKAFVVTQLALSLLLLVTAALFVRTLQNAMTVDAGFDPEQVVVGGIELDALGYDEESGQALYARLLDRLNAHPEIESASLARFPPMSGNVERTRVVPAGDDPDAEAILADFSVVDVGYFETLRMPVRAGRAFTAADGEGASPVTVINETLAERLWPGASPIGRQLGIGSRVLDVVGVVADGKYEGYRDEDVGYMYFPLAQSYSGAMTVHARVRGATGAGIQTIREELAGLDPDLALQQAEPLANTMVFLLFPQRMAALLIGSFGLVGLLLAAIGVYGILAYHVNRRTREIGVRMALGARAPDVIRLVIRGGLTLVAIGVAVGLGASFLLTRLLRGMLYGVTPTDPLTFVAVPLLLAAVALLASYLPARRATRVDPMTALRYE